MQEEYPLFCQKHKHDGWIVSSYYFKKLLPKTDCKSCTKKKKEPAKWYKLNDKKTDVDFIELWEETAWRAVKLTRVAKFRLFFFFSKQHFIFSIINNLSPLLIRMEHQISTWHRASGAPKTFSTTMSLFLVLLYFCNKP